MVQDGVAYDDELLAGWAPGTICKQAVDPHGGSDASSGGVPDPHRPVASGGGEPGAVRGDRHRAHPAGVAGQGGALPAGPLATGTSAPRTTGQKRPATL